MLYHLTSVGEWEEAVAAGEYRGSTLGRSLAEVGFVHCSYARQVERTGQALFADRDDVVMLAIDPDRLPAEIREEAAEPDGEVFPHVYGPIPVAAVVAVTPWPPRR